MTGGTAGEVVGTDADSKKACGYREIRIWDGDLLNVRGAEAGGPAEDQDIEIQSFSEHAFSSPEKVLPGKRGLECRMGLYRMQVQSHGSQSSIPTSQVPEREVPRAMSAIAWHPREIERDRDVRSQFDSSPDVQISPAWADLNN